MPFLSRRRSEPAAQQLLGLCEQLAGPATALAASAADRILEGYERLPEAERLAFLAGLCARFAPDSGRLDRAVAAFQARRDPASLVELHAASEPRRQQLIRNLNLARDGTARLLRLRADLQAWRTRVPSAAALDADLAHLLASWFNAGFLRLERITWSSSASLLRKIIAYEAVHEIDDWEELRRRVEPADRRCYAFFHARMPDEPLIFVEVALTPSVPDSLEPLLSPSRPACPAERARVAVFYSISNCQEGLRGIPFGSFLIRQVTDALRAELPGLRTFVTLSPLPGFRAWAEGLEGGPIEPSKVSPEAVRRLAARYLLTARTPSGDILDPVARFHLGNGASVSDIRPSADPSQKGARQSFGAMVNYLYELGELERNRTAFERGEVRAAGRIRTWARASPG